MLDRRLEHTGRNGQIEEPVVFRGRSRLDLLESLLHVLVDRILGEVAARVERPLAQPLPHRLVNFGYLVRAPHRLAHQLPVARVVAGVVADGQQRKTIGEQFLLRQIVDAGYQFPFTEISRGAENHQRARIRLVASGHDFFTA
jgi:hypothetical protein